MKFYVDICTLFNLKRKNCSPFISQLEFAVEQTWTVTHYFVLDWHEKSLWKHLSLSVWSIKILSGSKQYILCGISLCVYGNKQYFITINTVLLDYTSHTYTPAVKMMSGWSSTDKDLWPFSQAPDVWLLSVLVQYQWINSNPTWSWELSFTFQLIFQLGK